MPVYEPKSPAGSTHRRFQDAVRALRAAGVHWAFNIPGKEFTDAIHVNDRRVSKKGNPEETPNAFTATCGEGRLVWINGMAGEMIYSKETKRQEKMVNSDDFVLSVYHSNDAAPAVVSAFALAGFAVEWDGSDSEAVRITIPAGA